MAPQRQGMWDQPGLGQRGCREPQGCVHSVPSAREARRTAAARAQPPQADDGDGRCGARAVGWLGAGPSPPTAAPLPAAAQRARGRHEEPCWQQYEPQQQPNQGGTALGLFQLFALSRAARAGPQSSAKGNQRMWLYQGSWVRSGNTATAIASCSPRGQRPQLRWRCFQAKATAKGRAPATASPLPAPPALELASPDHCLPQSSAAPAGAIGAPEQQGPFSASQAMEPMPAHARQQPEGEANEHHHHWSAAQVGDPVRAAASQCPAPAAARAL